MFLCAPAAEVALSKILARPRITPCLCSRNAEKILGFLNTGVLSKELIPPHINFSHLSAEDYAEMYGVIKTVKEDNFAQLGLDACLLEDELNKVRVQLWGDEWTTWVIKQMQNCCYL